MPERIIVTGGAGYIGSHTVVELQNDGFKKGGLSYGTRLTLLADCFSFPSATL